MREHFSLCFYKNSLSLHYVHHISIKCIESSFNSYNKVYSIACLVVVSEAWSDTNEIKLRWKVQLKSALQKFNTISNFTKEAFNRKKKRALKSKKMIFEKMLNT